MNKNDYINELNNIYGSEQYKNRLFSSYIETKKGGRTIMKRKPNSSKIAVLMGAIIIMCTILGTIVVLKNGKSENNSNDTAKSDNSIVPIESSLLPIECTVSRDNSKCILNITITNKANRDVSVNPEFEVSKIVDGKEINSTIDYSKVEYDSATEQMFLIKAGGKYHIALDLYDACANEFNSIINYNGNYKITFLYVGSIVMSSFSETHNDFCIGDEDINDNTAPLKLVSSKISKDYSLTGTYKNISNSDIGTGEDFVLYYSPWEANGPYAAVDMKSDAAWNEIYNHILSGTDYILNLNINTIYDTSKLQSGYYIIVKEFECGDETKYMVMGEFEIKDKN